MHPCNGLLNASKTYGFRITLDLYCNPLSTTLGYYINAKVPALMGHICLITELAEKGGNILLKFSTFHLVDLGKFTGREIFLPPKPQVEKPPKQDNSCESEKNIRLGSYSAQTNKKGV